VVPKATNLVAFGEALPPQDNILLVLLGGEAAQKHQ
jgi:hypothetical protein